MSVYFTLVELLMFVGAGYFLIYKKDLAIIYLPALFFASSVRVSMLPAIIEYAFFSFYIGYLIYRNPYFYKSNIFAILLFILHIILIPGSSDLVFIRPTLFAILWTLLLIPLTTHILKRYSRKLIFKELYQSALVILCLFVANVAFSTVFNYSPYEMYGMQSGIMYGELVDTDFNILAISIFIAFFFLTYKMSPFYIFTTLISLSVIGLSMRRSVIGACILGFAFILLILIIRGQRQQAFLILGTILFVGIVVISFTEFTSLFQERFEQRNLSERELAGEIRFAEYALLYKDAFVHYDFNPWIGYELLNSGGNYGKGLYGNRSLHGDITNIIHSSGIVGLMLYILMIFKVFLEAIRHKKTNTDLLIIFFCFLIFITFSVTGRYSQSGYMILFILLLSLPLGKVEKPENITDNKPTLPPS